VSFLAAAGEFETDQTLPDINRTVWSSADLVAMVR
jgi:hypothetical protein